jgi:hypothetical protein
MDRKMVEYYKRGLKNSRQQNAMYNYGQGGGNTVDRSTAKFSRRGW